MKIRHIEIKNFRGIKHLSQYFEGDFICLIGPGDSCKSTILDAIDYTLSPRKNIDIDDTDFYGQNITELIEIKITLSDWDKTDPNVRYILQEELFGQFICGLMQEGPVSEPDENSKPGLTIAFRVDQSLEPEWLIVKDDEEKRISASNRDKFGASRIGKFVNAHFAWHQNSLLNRIFSDVDQREINKALTEFSRDLQINNESLAGFEGASRKLKEESQTIGVHLGDELQSKIDTQKVSLKSGVVTLHQGNIPLRNLGSGSKKLISCAMQMLLNDGKNTSIIDELEHGLEPHRIRGLLYKLRSTNQQIITTTHSPVVLRELDVKYNELFVCQSKSDGTVGLTSLDDVPNVQGPLRSNAEAFLGKKIVVCEGATEIGCLRALDKHKFREGNEIPVWSLATAYFDANGANNIKNSAEALKKAGYDVSVLCDNDEPEKFSDENKQDLENLEINVINWEQDNAIENQLFIDMPKRHIPDLIDFIVDCNEDLSKQSVRDQISAPYKSKLPEDINDWEFDDKQRRVIGNQAKKGKKPWFKRIDRAESVFEYALPYLSDESIIKTRLLELWRWIQNG